MAIGRLDEDSEGLLLLTTDGKISERVRRKSVEKEYYVQVNGQITQEAIERLQNGVEISLPRQQQQQQQQGGDDNEDDVIDIGDSSSTLPPPSSNMYKTLPCKVRILDTAMVNVASSTAIADDGTTKSGEEDVEPKKKKRRKKFSGTCNKCNQTGHKAKECSENPIDLSSLKQHGASSIGSNGSNNVNDVEQQHHYFMLLPKGIPPPAASTQHRLYNNHRLTSTSVNTMTSSWISITINEGKNRQVRRMTAAVGFPTIRLVRVRIGCVTLDGMAPGEVRELKEDDIINI
jgi:16S rRNA U516 pseudouridylate synthase RsuA-like enzyme